MIFNNDKIYDILVYVAQIALPALALLVTEIARIWGLPYGVEISETIMAIDACLGAFLMIGKKRYEKQLEEDDI